MYLHEVPWVVIDGLPYTALFLRGRLTDLGSLHSLKSIGPDPLHRCGVNTLNVCEDNFMIPTSIISKLYRRSCDIKILLLDLKDPPSVFSYALLMMPKSRAC